MTYVLCRCNLCKNLDSDQAWQNIRPDPDLLWHTENGPKKISEKSLFYKILDYKEHKTMHNVQRVKPKVSGPQARNKYTVKPVLSGHSKIDKTKNLMTNGSLMKVESIAECSPWSILQYFWPALSDNRSWKPIFVFFLGGRLSRFYCNYQSKRLSADDKSSR